jgi:hypothetical protein
LKLIKHNTVLAALQHTLCQLLFILHNHYIAVQAPCCTHVEPGQMLPAGQQPAAGTAQQGTAGTAEAAEAADTMQVSRSNTDSAVVKNFLVILLAALGPAIILCYKLLLPAVNRTDATAPIKDAQVG